MTRLKIRDTLPCCKKLRLFATIRPSLPLECRSASIFRIFLGKRGFVSRYLVRNMPNDKHAQTGIAIYEIRGSQLLAVFPNVRYNVST